MKLPWTKPAAASLDELREQLDEARKANAEAQEGVAQALAAFDADPTDAAAKALSKAREHADVMREHLGRAERLFKAAEERAAEERRKALQAKRVELDKTLAAPALAAERAPLENEEIDLLVKLAIVRARRRELERQIVSRQHRLRTVREELGETVGPLMAPSFDPSPLRVVAALEERARAEQDDDVRRALREVARGADPRNTIHAGIGG